MTHQDILTTAAKWLKKEGGCVTAFQVASDKAEEEQTAFLLGVGSFGRTVVLKPYLSREDFLEDQQAEFQDIPGMDVGQYRFLLSPPGIMLEAEVPQNWGLLQLQESKEITTLVNPYQPAGGSFWRPGFADVNSYELLLSNELIYAASKRLRYASVLRIQMAF